MNESRRRKIRWRLADVLDFEVRIAGTEPAVDARDRLLFGRDIRPRFDGLPPVEQRRVGLRLWLDSQPAKGHIGPGAAWTRATRWLWRLLFLGMAISGGLLVCGLCLGNGQRVHVVVFLALTLWLPWALFGVSWLLRRLLGLDSLGVGWLLSLAGRRVSGSDGQTRDQRLESMQGLAQTLRGSHAVAGALSARIGALLQCGGLGFSLGVVIAFVATLMVFDVRFYWEATPAEDGLMQAAVTTVAMPWRAVWPAAVPDSGDIQISRRHTGAAAQRVPGGAVAGAWWRFLVMSVLFWGVLPRLLLLLWFGWSERRSLARMDFQAPRHRALWRALAGIERGQTAAAAADAALVLDVGGSGFDGTAIRGFMLRRLRVNPQATHRVSVLDEAAEAAADRALANAPAHVVLAVLDWSLSPRQASGLQQRIRRLTGATTPITWVVLGGDPAGPTAPATHAHQRWTAFIDGLADPATEVVAYDPSA